MRHLVQSRRQSYVFQLLVFTIIALVLCGLGIARAQQKSELTFGNEFLLPSPISSREPSSPFWITKPERRSSVAEYVLTASENGKERFRFRKDGLVIVSDEALRGPCSPDKWVEALNLADGEFLPHPERAPIADAWRSVPTHTLTPTELRAEADRTEKLEHLKAIEAERRRAALTQIRELLHTCQ
jgi:hypothetical protein